MRLHVVFLDIDEAVRRRRLMQRTHNNQAQVAARIELDSRTFCDFVDYNVKITLPDFSVADVLVRCCYGE